MTGAFCASVITVGALCLVQPVRLSATQEPAAAKVLPVPPVIYPPAPRTLAGVLNSADLTALVQIRARHYEVRDGDGNAKDVVTRYEGRVLENLRDKARRPGGTGSNIDLIQSGGFIETPQGVIEYVDKNFPRLRPGMKVLLVLEWNEHYNAYRFYYGPDSSFEMDEPSGKVRTHGKTAVSRAQLDLPVQAFLAQARQAVKR